jgi:DNA-binding CsgD family transcriptional regulator
VCSSRLGELPDATFRDFVERLPDGVLIFDSARHPQLANRAGRLALALAAAAGEPGRPGGRPPAAGELLAAVPALTSAGGAPAARARLAISSTCGLHLEGHRLALRHVGLLVRREVVREHELHRQLVEQLGLSASAARLAARVCRGWSSVAIARAFGLPAATVRWRLHRIYAQLGVRSRTALLARLAESLQPEPVVAEAAEAPTDDGGDHPSPAALAAARAFLDRLEIGYAAVTPEGRLRWANAAARRLLLDDRAAVAAVGGAVAALLAGLLRDGRPALESARLVLPRRTLRAAVWRSGVGLLGLRLHQESPRAEESETHLQATFGLSPRQAQAAVLLVAGRSNREIGTDLGISEGGVVSLSSRVYAKLGVAGRAALAALYSEMIPRDRSPAAPRSSTTAHVPGRTRP